MPEFDAYLMVDWSAQSSPKSGEDAIWYCMARRPRSQLILEEPKNVRTRHEAVSQIRSLLAHNVEKEVATLVGFDFPYGFPTGCTRALGLDSETVAPWRALWDTLSRNIKDSPRNENNRFAVAAEFNNQISGGPYPFWGCPEKHQYTTLSRKKTRVSLRIELAEYRLTEERVRGAQSAWKLLGHGSVGSQALLGIPYVARLRDDPSLRKVSRVWPFETGMAKLPSREDRDWLVLHAEIFPSMIKVKPREREAKDAAQVRGLARHFALMDDEGCLSRLFNVPTELSADEVHRVETEEGWILGVE
ncbi:MAG TPA: cobalamin biosynthesis protein CbiG [Candidatus Xenobia bacterium]|nr:cobalamin biosynthesis protein CbiG [Candidatus Xenobia bacterium]